ncbi:MAG: T9SS type A sorting domain-containing protein [Saprospiraceae bacterium]|nr:T9SS type A sorting domain-containing protein [Saprospiraceae bacterium]
MKNLIILVLFIFVSNLILAQAVVYDNNGTGIGVSPVFPSTTITLPNFSVPANNDRLLVVCTINVANDQPPAVTFNGTSMIKGATRTTLGSGSRMTLYYLTLGSGASSITSDIAATGGTPRIIIAGSFYNVNQTVPIDGRDSITFESNASTSFTQTRSMVSRSVDRVCDCIGAFAGSNSITGYSNDNGQTLMGKYTNLVFGGMSTKAGASSVPMSWTYNGNFSSSASPDNTLRGSQVGINIRSVSTLPIELVFFKGKQAKEGNELYWQSATESNNKGFYVQRSKDGVKWQDIKFVSGQGTTSQTNNYTWIDDKPLLGYNYYRLKQVDFNESFDYSPVVLIVSRKSDKVLVYPNPAGNELFYDFNDLKSVQSIELYDATGKLMQETTNINGKLSIAQLPSGLYWFLLKTETGNIYERVVKQ